MTALRRLSLAHWLVVATLSGVAFGLLFPAAAPHLQPVSDIFLRLIRAVIAPLLCGVLVRAVAGAGSLHALGRLGLRSLVVFEIATTLALLLGWGAALLLQPGAGVSLPAAAPTPAAAPMTFTGVLVNAFPTSIVDALARGDVLQIVVFCFIFGTACLAVGERARPVLALADALAEVGFKFTHFVMWLAPAAVFAALAGTVAAGGSGALGGLARFVGVSWGAQLVFLTAVLGGGLAVARVPLGAWMRAAREPFLVAFATTSSAAALPQVLENLEKFGVPRRILGVVAPLSVSLNLNGSTLHLGFATFFIAQAAGIPLSLEKQLLVLLTLKLASKGVAGIPRANFIVLAAVFPMCGLPPEGLALLLGLDALLDPIRTATNVASHCAAPAIVARWEGADTASR